MCQCEPSRLRNTNWPAKGTSKSLSLRSPPLSVPADTFKPWARSSPTVRCSGWAHSNFFNNTCTQKLTPKRPLRISLAGLGAVTMPRPTPHSQLGTIAVTHLPMPHQAHLPFNLLTLLGQAQLRPQLAAPGASPLGLTEPVLDDALGQIQAPLPLGAFAPALLASGSWARSLWLCPFPPQDLGHQPRPAPPSRSIGRLAPLRPPSGGPSGLRTCAQTVAC
jgi:hypothetical protein